MVWFVNKIGEVTLMQCKAHLGRVGNMAEAWSTGSGSLQQEGRWGCNRRAWKLEVPHWGRGAPSSTGGKGVKQVWSLPRWES